VSCPEFDPANGVSTFLRNSSFKQRHSIRSHNAVVLIPCNVFTCLCFVCLDSLGVDANSFYV